MSEIDLNELRLHHYVRPGDTGCICIGERSYCEVLPLLSIIDEKEGRLVEVHKEIGRWQANDHAAARRIALLEHCVKTITGLTVEQWQALHPEEDATTKAGSWQHMPDPEEGKK